MKRLHKACIGVYSWVSAFVLTPFIAQAQVEGVTGGLKEAAGEAGLGTENQQSIEEIIGNVVNAALALLGVLFLVMLVYAGFMYLTAGGDTDKVEKAKRLIGQAIIGMVIIATAYALSEFVIVQLITAVQGGGGG